MGEIHAIRKQADAVRKNSFYSVEYMNSHDRISKHLPYPKLSLDRC